ncbi:unnamed protein product [marine sediment metagenome]|uniref:Uncharacterized protein n=1 Tax=marine sediment metagenome TaxID=412755 RepID=X1QLU1_9ZZZZ
MSIVRAETIARMRDAFRKGMSASRFIADMKSAGLSYRRTVMLSDWRSVNQLEVKAGLLQYVRKDRYPTATSMAAVEWNISQEYMYILKVQSILAPGMPVIERKVNILSDRPLTPAQAESEVTQQWQEWEKYAPETLTGIQAWSAVHKVME